MRHCWNRGDEERVVDSNIGTTAAEEERGKREEVDDVVVASDAFQPRPVWA
jgi:hypothetical protein